jgi:hypothetical protein
LPPDFKTRIKNQVAAQLSKGYNNKGSFWWPKICFSDARASFQLACFTFIFRMGGAGENNGIWGSFEERWFKKSHLCFYCDLKPNLSAR